MGNRNLSQAFLMDIVNSAGIFSLITAIKGESTWTAMAKELMRDFGGVSASYKDIAKYIEALGITEGQGWGIRKDILASPAFLTAMYPSVLEQKKLDEFLKSLENITTAWGTGNFRAAFEEWMNTGSVTALNKAYIDLFGSSKDLNSALADWRNILLLIDDSTQALDDTIKAVVSSGRASADAIEYLGRQVAATGDGVDIFGNRIISTNKAMADWVDNLRNGGSGGGAGARAITPIIPVSQVRGGIASIEYLGRAARGTGSYIDIFGQLVNTAGVALATMSTTGIRSMNGFSGAVARASGATSRTSSGLAGSALPSAITGPMSSFMYSGIGPAVYNASLGPDPNSSAWDIWRARLAEAIGSQSGPTYIFNGDVYGFEDFINAVMAANLDINRRGTGATGGTYPVSSRR
jgi:hypothetical protein